MNVSSIDRYGADRAHSTGFTLVEVMVTLALTMVMMAMFASIFQIAGNFVTRQKGIGENDQSARILTTVLKTDLQSRTMRFLAPFHPNMSPLGDDTTNRLGYFYYSENNPMDDTDDVLQFTVGLNVANFLSTTNPTRGTVFTGLATNLPLPWQPGTNYAAGAYVRPAGTTSNSQPTGFIYKNNGTALVSGTSEPTWSTGTPALGSTLNDNGGTWTTVASAIDQPDGDDAVMSYLTSPPVGATSAGTETINPPNTNPNNAGASQFAEVTYFLRHGNLYRRILLIRNPYNLGVNSISPPASSQPYAQDTPLTNLIQGSYPPAGYANNTFWRDFDFAARINPTAVSPAPGVQFLAYSSPESSLDNLNISSGIPIARPDNRFGFDQVYQIPPATAAGTETVNGAPREFALPFNSSTNTITSATPAFFGRYTDEETSNAKFLFPGALPSVGGTPTSPMGYASILGLDSSSYTMWLLNANPPTAPSVNFVGGSRRGEDIVMTNVISFDVKIWDPHYSEFTTTGTQYDWNHNGIIDAGPAFADVGHVAASGDFQQAKNAFPVFGPNIQTGYTVPVAGTNTWAPAYTYTQNGVTFNYNNVFDTWYRFFNFDNLPRIYDQNDPPPPGTTPNLYAPAPYRPRLGVQWQPNTAYQLGQQVDPVNTANGYVYVCTTPGTSAASPPAGQPDPFSLSDVAGTPLTTLDGTVQWQPQPPVAVQAIQITVKYLDPTQNLLRQVTIVQSLTQ